MSRIAVYGWYGHNNIGDEAYKLAFCEMLVGHDLVFMDTMPKDPQNFDALIVGGGSFLEAPVRGSVSHTIPVAFVSVGSRAVHPTWKPYLERAAVVVVRDLQTQATLSRYSSNVKVLPDLVFGLTNLFDDKVSETPSLLYIPNVHLLPKGQSPSYVKAAWDWFSCQLAEAFDHLSQKYSIQILGMCSNKSENDLWAGASVISQMSNRARAELITNPSLHHGSFGFEDIIRDKHIVVTQRLHGYVYARKYNKKCVTISHHDKLNDVVNYMDGVSPNSSTALLDYYAFSKKVFYESLDALLRAPTQSPIPKENTLECTRTFLADASFV